MQLVGAAAAVANTKKDSLIKKVARKKEHISARRVGRALGRDRVTGIEVAKV